MNDQHPILFNGEMVRAVLAGRKTQTRRVIRPQPSGAWAVPPVTVSAGRWTSHGCMSDLRCPYGTPGDLLWVREAWQYLGSSWRVGEPYEKHRVRYLADDTRGEVKLSYPCTLPPHQTKPKNYESRYLDKYPADFEGREEMAWHDFLTDWWRKARPARFMPRWASRITLLVTGVRVERVQDITEADAIAGGCGFGHNYGDGTARTGFAMLWDSINAKRGAGWDVNPWVWVVEFRPLAALGEE